MKDYDSEKNDSVVEDEETVKQIVEGLEKIDQLNPVSTPNLQWFQQHVEVEKKRIRKKQWTDLFLFIVVAVFVLSVAVTVFYQQPMTFLYFQLVGLILLPVALRKTRKKVSDE